MAGRNSRHPMLPQHTPEKCIARIPRPALERPSGLRHETHPLTVHRHSQLQSQLPNKDFIFFRLIATEPIIDVGNAEVDPGQQNPFPHLMQEREETDGVRPSRNGDKHTAVRLNQPLAPDGLRDLSEDGMGRPVVESIHTLTHDNMERAVAPESLRKISRARSTSAAICRASASADSKA